jgi:hypothetical protein
LITKQASGLNVGDNNMTKNGFILLICFFFVCFTCFGEHSQYVAKIVHEDLSLNKTLIDQPALEKQMQLVLDALLTSLRDEEEYSKVAVCNAIAFIDNNKQTTQAYFVKFCLGYYLSEVSIHCAGRRDIFVEMIDDSSKILKSIVEDNEDSWEAKFTALMLSKEDQILIRDIDPDYGNNPKVVEIYIARGRANLSKISNFNLMTKDKNFNDFEKYWLEIPYTAEFINYSIVSNLLYLKKKDEAEKEFNNFKADFPDSKYIKDLEKKFFEYSKPKKEEKGLFDCD